MKPVTSSVSGLPGRACEAPDVLVGVAGQGVSDAGIAAISARASAHLVSGSWPASPVNRASVCWPPTGMSQDGGRALPATA